MIKLFLDDTRQPPDSSWRVVRNYEEFVWYLGAWGMPDIISFDHDLAFEHYPFNETNPVGDNIPYNQYREKTGYDCAKYIVDNRLPLQAWLVHSMNPVGAENIRQLLKKYTQPA